MDSSSVQQTKSMEGMIFKDEHFKRGDTPLADPLKSMKALWQGVIK